MKKIMCTTLFVLFIALASIFAYSLTREKAEDVSEPVQNVQKVTPAGNKELLKTKYGLIYVQEADSSEIELLIIEALNPITEQLWYIILPAGTRYLMSQQLFADLSAVYPQQPQLVVLSELCEYYDGAEGYERGLEIVGELSGTKLEYYTVFTREQLERVFSVQESTLGISLSLTAQSDDEAVLRDGSVKQYIGELYSDVVTSWSLADRLVYLEIYDRLDSQDVFFMTAEGEYENSGFKADTQKLSQLLLQIAAEY